MQFIAKHADNWQAILGRLGLQATLDEIRGQMIDAPEGDVSALTAALRYFAEVKLCDMPSTQRQLGLRLRQELETDNVSGSVVTPQQVELRDDRDRLRNDVERRLAEERELEPLLKRRRELLAKVKDLEQRELELRHNCQELGIDYEQSGESRPVPAMGGARSEPESGERHPGDPGLEGRNRSIDTAVAGVAGVPQGHPSGDLQTGIAGKPSDSANAATQ